MDTNDMNLKEKIVRENCQSIAKIQEVLMTDKYITLTNELEQGEYTFQVKVENEGLVLDIFRRNLITGEDYLIDTTYVFYADVGLFAEVER